MTGGPMISKYLFIIGCGLLLHPLFSLLFLNGFPYDTSFRPSSYELEVYAKVFVEQLSALRGIPLSVAFFLGSITAKQHGW